MNDRYTEPQINVSDLRPRSWEHFRLDKPFADMTIEERTELYHRDPERYRRERAETFGEEAE